VSKTPEVKYVDLFAGIGGFAAALTALGAECVQAVERDATAARVYKRNWGHEALGNIVDNDSPTKTISVGKHDILTAGFPCQPFSKSGAQAGVLDKSRGTLFHNILTIIRELDYADRPTLVILENVRNLSGPKHKNDLAVIKQSLRHLGYTVEEENFFLSPHRIHRKFGGRPQNRDRIFIVGTKLPPDLAGNPHKVSGYTTQIESYLSGLPAKINEIASGYLIDVDPKTYWDATSDLQAVKGVNAAGLALKANELDLLNVWDEFIQNLRGSGVQPPGFPLWTEFWVSKVKIPKDCPDWKRTFIEKNSKFYRDNSDVCTKLLGELDSKDFVKSHRKFEWQAGDLTSVWKAVVHLRPSGVRVKKPNYFPALVAITHVPILAFEKRRLSVKEAAFLQGFPRNFDFEDETEGQYYKQLGNAVNVAAVWVAVRSLVQRDADILSKTETGRNIVKLVSDSPDSPDKFFKTWNPPKNSS
jgi:DNA (cytosine-5)-methyltransferase 1